MKHSTIPILIILLCCFFAFSTTGKAESKQENAATADEENRPSPAQQQNAVESEKKQPEKASPVKQQKKVKVPKKTPFVFSKEEIKKHYKELYKIFVDNYIPHIVLTNLARDMDYAEYERQDFLDAISSLDRETLEKLLAFYDERTSKTYRRLMSKIRRDKRIRTDIPHDRIIKEAINYRYYRLKASKRDKIMVRINTRKRPTRQEQAAAIKPLSSYPLDKLIKEIESRGWGIKLERHPDYIRKNKVPVI